MNHFWWSLQTAGDNPEELIERFQSIVYHVIDKHHWPGHVFFNKCFHEKIPNTEARKVKWMKGDTPAYTEFRKIVLNPSVRKDLMQMSGGIHTTALEVC